MQSAPKSKTGQGADFIRWFRSRLQGVFCVESITTGALENRAVRIQGRFLIESERAYEELRPALAKRNKTLLLRQEGDAEVIYAVDGVVHPEPNNRWLPWVLGVVTILSVLLTYTVFWEMQTLSWSSFLQGLPNGALFAGSLMAILLSHELGHYFMAQRYGVMVTLPYLIPFPLSPFGTMGAVIRIKDVPPNRRAMLLIGAAGPLAGLVVALPIILIGIALSSVTALPTSGGYIMEGNSLLYAALKFLVHGRWLPGQGQDMIMHPVAFAGWAGLLVTSFNLLPAGQLDGGHVAYALLHKKARYLTWAIIAALIGLGFIWDGWFLWAGLVFIFSRKNVVPLDDLSSLRSKDVVLAILLLALFVLTFTPVPMRVVEHETLQSVLSVRIRG